MEELLPTSSVTSKSLLVTAADQNYLEKAKQFFVNAYFNSGWTGDYLLLSHNIPEPDLVWFRAKGILVKDCPPLISSMPGRWPPVVLAKFYLFTTEFKAWDQIIYLDADMLIQASLDDLTKIRGLASLNIDPFFKKTKLLDYFDQNSPQFDQELFKAIKNRYDLKALGFSGGILAFNTEMIHDRLFSDIIKLLPITKFSHWPDEIILNLVFNHQWQRLPCPYNLNHLDLKTLCGLKIDRQRGIIFHLNDPSVLLIKGSLMGQEIQGNRLRAEKIDLTARPPAREIWTDLMIRRYSLYLYLRYIGYWPHHQTDRLIGQIGLYLAKNYPQFYIVLKKKCFNH